MILACDESESERERIDPSLPLSLSAADATDDTTGTSSDALSPRVTVGIIVGISGIATILIITVLYALMICKYCIFRFNYKKSKHELQRAGSTGHGLASTSGSFSRAYNSYSMTPFSQPPQRPSSGYNASSFNSPVSHKGF